MATYILIHGAWHGAWCWERIIPLLTEQGHRVIAPDLPGMGLDKTPLSAITLDHWTQFVCDLVRKQNEKVILVGHSRGGIVISQVAEYVPEHIQELVYLCAFLIPNGATLLKTIQQHPRDPNRPPDLIISTDQKSSTIAPAAVRNTFYSTTEDAWVNRAATLAGPEPMTSFVTPLVLSESRFGRVPRVYIECLQDRAIPIELQRRMVSILPCKYVFTLDTDHSPFYSSPEKLALHLLQLDKFEK